MGNNAGCCASKDMYEDGASSIIATREINSGSVLAVPQKEPLKSNFATVQPTSELAKDEPQDSDIATQEPNSETPSEFVEDELAPVPATVLVGGTTNADKKAPQMDADRVKREESIKWSWMLSQEEAGEAERVKRFEEQNREAESVLQRQREEAEAIKVKAEAAAEAARLYVAQARKLAVKKFLMENQFKDVNTGKVSFTKTTYPLHEAAKQNNISMVNMLVEEGANIQQRNSSNQTPLQRAIQEDRSNSHREVIDALKGFPAR